MKTWPLIALASLTASFAQADACKSSFVQCVQKTGNPATCQSTYAQCNTQSKTALETQVNTAPNNTDVLDISPRLISENGLDVIQLWVANPTNQRVQVGSLSFDVRCADGKTQTAYFSLDGEFSPQSKPRAVGYNQVVCATQGGAVALMNQSDAREQGLASNANKVLFFYQCSDNQRHSIEMIHHKAPNGSGYYRWTSTRGTQGVFNQDFAVNDDFMALACGQIPAPNWYSKIRKELKSILSGAGDTAPTLPTKSTGIGVRG